jgi:TonB family protein
MAAQDEPGLSWGDRLYGYGERGELPSLRTEAVERFGADSIWTSAMGADEGFATLRNFSAAGEGVLGLKVEFLRRSRTSVLVAPPRPILVDSRCAMLSIRVLSRNFRHTLSFVVLDYYGQSYELSLGLLDFSGWKTMSAAVPLFDPAAGTGIVQDDRHYTSPPGLRIAAMKVDFDPDEAYGDFYVYFSDIEATVEGLSPSVSTNGAAEAAPPVEAASVEAATLEPPPAAKPEDAAKAGSRILSTLSGRIQAALAYPAAARRRGVEGTVVLSFSVDARGDLAGARVAQSSGSPILDSAGLELLRSVFPVDNDSGARLDLRIAIGYKLSGTGP